jgi:hypothetical protein
VTPAPEIVSAPELLLTTKITVPVGKVTEAFVGTVSVAVDPLVM